jgi:hypothetical protein
VTTVKTNVLIAVLFAACAAQTQTLKIITVHPDGTVPVPKGIQFLCTQNYDQQSCLHDASVLRQALAPYPLEQLGSWSFVLVPADDWKNLVRSLGGDPVSPAFSPIDQHTTVMDQSLFSGSANRTKDFLRVYRLSGQPLLDLAVTHEMGHGICQEKDERRADEYGRQLRGGKTPDCSQTPGY